MKKEGLESEQIYDADWQDLTWSYVQDNIHIHVCAHMYTTHTQSTRPRMANIFNIVKWGHHF